MKLRIYHSVNEGLYLWNGKTGLLIDALHAGKEQGFSDTPERYVRLMEAGESFFERPSDLLFTHLHEDHYDAVLTEKFLDKYPGRRVFAPGLDRNNSEPVVLEQGVFRLVIEEYEIFGFWTEHDGKALRQCPHCSYLIRWQDTWIWVSGDARLTPCLVPQIRKIVGDGRLCMAFVMVYQIARQEGREFLKELSPGQTCLYHLPYPWDDTEGYYGLAEQMCQRCRAEGIPVRKAQPDHFVM